MPDAGICYGQRKGRTMQMVQGYIGRRDEVPAGTGLSAEDIYTVLMKQLRILVFKEHRCFDSVELEKRNVEVRYCFICSAQFYDVCQQNPEAVDLNGFV